MTYAAQALNKLNDLQYIEAMRSSAEKIWESAQASFQKAQQESTVTVSKLAHKNLLAMAKRADQLSEKLTELAEKLEPMTAAPAKARKLVKKPAAKAKAEAKVEVKAEVKPAKKAVAKKAAAPKAKAVKAAKPAAVEAPAAETEAAAA